MNITSRMIAGATLALAVTPAIAAIDFTPFPGETLLEDDNLDFHLRWNGTELVPANSTFIRGRNDSGNTTGVGDVLIAIAELVAVPGLGAGQEMTIVSVIEAVAVDGITFVFAPYQFGFNAASGLGIPFGGAGAGAMLAVWLDNSPNLNIGGNLIPTDNLSCTSLAQCIGQASDGDLWVVDGFADADDYWYSLATETNPQNILTSSVGARPGIVSAGLSILYEDPSVIGGTSLARNQFSGDAFGNGGALVDTIVSGTLNGGGFVNSVAQPQPRLALLVADGYVASSDFDKVVVGAVPVPAPLALMAAGLLGISLTRRLRA